MFVANTFLGEDLLVVGGECFFVDNELLTELVEAAAKLFFEAELFETEAELFCEVEAELIFEAETKLLMEAVAEFFEAVAELFLEAELFVFANFVVLTLAASEALLLVLLEEAFLSSVGFRIGKLLSCLSLIFK